MLMKQKNYLHSIDDLMKVILKKPEREWWKKRKYHNFIQYRKRKEQQHEYDQKESETKILLYRRYWMKNMKNLHDSKELKSIINLLIIFNQVKTIQEDENRWIENSHKINLLCIFRWMMFVFLHKYLLVFMKSTIITIKDVVMISYAEFDFSTWSE